MNLADLSIGTEARVTAVTGKTAAAKRLMEMGVVPGASVRVVKIALFGSPLEVCVRGYHLAMRKSEAEIIEVETERV